MKYGLASQREGIFYTKYGFTNWKKAIFDLYPKVTYQEYMNSRVIMLISIIP